MRAEHCHLLWNDLVTLFMAAGIQEHIWEQCGVADATLVAVITHHSDLWWEVSIYSLHNVSIWYHV